MKYPKGIKAVFDNGGKTVDRYTIVFPRIYDTNGTIIFYTAICCASNVSVFYQHIGVMLGKNKKHLGVLISWRALPKEIRERANIERKDYA